ncbi:MAG: HDOD domain-containing protein, partial [Burkholderiales bacterium]
NTAEANGDMVFTLGMLHAVGQLQMHLGMPSKMAPLDRKMSVMSAGRAELEKDTFGFHYGDVSAELAKIWNFPQNLIVALRAVPQPLAQDPFSESAGWVHLGAWRARTEVLEMTDEEIVDSYPEEVGKRLGIDRRWVAAINAQTPGLTEQEIMPPLKALTEGLDAMLE